jgi:hypothetical protein
MLSIAVQQESGPFGASQRLRLEHPQVLAFSMSLTLMTLDRHRHADKAGRRTSEDVVPSVATRRRHRAAVSYTVGIGATDGTLESRRRDRVVLNPKLDM